MDTLSTETQNKKTVYNDRDTRIHQEALRAATNFKRSEIDLIEKLEAVDQYRVYYKHGCNSLFSYAVSVLGLSEPVAGIFINVCRKTREVPALKAEIRNGTITVSKARRMTAVINKDNQSHWINLAKSSSKHQLEKQIAIASPKEMIREKLAYVHPTLEIDNVQIKKLGASSRDVRVQLQTGVSEQLMLKLRRVQDLVSSQKRKAASLEESLEAMADLFLNRHDPLERAKRQKIRGKLNTQKIVEPNSTELKSAEPKCMEPNQGELKLDETRNKEPKPSDLKSIDPKHVKLNLGELNPAAPIYLKPNSEELNPMELMHVKPTRGDLKAMELTSKKPNPGELESMKPKFDEPGFAIPKATRPQSTKSALAELKITTHKSSAQAPALKSRCPGITNVGNELQKSPYKRTRLTASLKHQVNLIHESRCAFVDANGKRCEQRRHMDVHHIILVSQGGTNEISNLTLLCAGHHRLEHRH